MSDYNEELNLIFKEWDLESTKIGYFGFCKDGLMRKGEIDQTEKGRWFRTKGNENERWGNSPKKILFLMKDTNINPGEDMRGWIGRQHETIISSMFFKNISLWLLGLNSFTDEGKYLPFEDAYIPEVFSKAFDDLPIAIVNLKKESGKGTVSNSQLWSYMEKSKKHSELLKKQIEILTPNIIVCGGGSGTVLNIAKKYVYPELEFKKINDWIYYNEEKSITMINSCHPTRNPYKRTYENMMNAYQEFIIKKKLINQENISNL
jgi:hypothetical protein